MAIEPLLPLDELLAPIPGDSPAGEPVSFAVRAEMEEARKEVNPDDFAPDDPYRPTEARKADWAGIVRRATKTLTSESKDLLVTARLTEALTRLHGFAGLAEGLRLLRRLVAECWDRLHPVIEDGDLEIRAGPFNWLGDDGRGARFPYTVRTIPLFRGEGRAFGLQDWRDVQDNKGTVNRDDLERAIAATPREQCQALVEALDGVVVEFNELVGLLNQHLGPVAPGMIDLRKAIDDTLLLCRQVLQRKGGAPLPAEEAHEGNGAAEASGSATPARAMANREDIYRRLSEAADLLEKMEPHSPVPFLIRRAVALGSLPFPQLMKALLREEFQQALTELNRELGIKEESSS